ncbi:FxsA family protein [Marinibacterium sp. SX1]|uniref:FxsA family protein n=1 Tax=Marinibacterium sp. SX1 TaxID=3388424 RepID=UPI003D1702A6
MPLFLAFLLVPLIEITLFVQVGGLIGLWPTLAIVVGTAMLGTWLVKSQGRQALQKLTGAFNDLRDPSEPLAEGAMILFAGVLLLTPGFFTDAVGFALLMPPVRLWLYRQVSARVTVQGFAAHPGAQRPGGPRGTGPQGFGGQGDIIDGDFTEVRPRDNDGPSRPSAWVEKDPDRH